MMAILATVADGKDMDGARSEERGDSMYTGG